MNSKWFATLLIAGVTLTACGQMAPAPVISPFVPVTAQSLVQAGNQQPATDTSVSDQLKSALVKSLKPVGIYGSVDIHSLKLGQVPAGKTAAPFTAQVETIAVYRVTQHALYNVVGTFEPTTQALTITSKTLAKSWIDSEV